MAFHVHRQEVVDEQMILFLKKKEKVKSFYV
jgi:hypothetical protein